MNYLTLFRDDENSVATLDDPRREVRVGAMIVIGFFVILLGWAAFAPLDAAVNAPGVIAVSGNRQSVQHRDGGVVTAIHVREGQKMPGRRDPRPKWGAPEPAPLPERGA